MARLGLNPSPELKNVSRGVFVHGAIVGVFYQRSLGSDAPLGERMRKIPVTVGAILRASTGVLMISGLPPGIKKNAGAVADAARIEVAGESVVLSSSISCHPGAMLTKTSPLVATDVLRRIASGDSPARRSITSSIVQALLTPLMRVRNPADSLRIALASMSRSFMSLWFR